MSKTPHTEIRISEAVVTDNEQFIIRLYSHANVGDSNSYIHIIDPWTKQIAINGVVVPEDIRIGPSQTYMTNNHDMTVSKNIGQFTWLFC